MRRKVLIVEDEPDIAHLVQTHLTDIGCDADIAGNGAAAMKLFKQGGYDLVVLDLMLPDTDGLTLCRSMRATPDYVAILMLTAKTTELDRVVGLEMGADDYLTKPFSIPELLARIKALFRRMEALQSKGAESDTQELVQRGGLSIDVDKRSVKIDDRPVELTAKEFDLLLFFARHPGRVFSRIQLLDKVWGYNHDGYEHTVNSHINRLRSKIEVDPADPRYVLTVWGVGYKFSEEQA
ncbi:MAG: DNA-binding response regulator [gamma proteobacterium symbiont of Ctena orbiculata]|uniref:Phosphate regulon transcriptional regulatory protein PhoB n=1 Tax=Candidatus Thiodiazotropha taylori TaxID=2792791 RepID=A0A944M8P1_9GAMM|nr:response regulator transcription factor [Candidatus Thiodiazotropha taylori]PUB85161.1 MAG: DNA-binding response regulator [gamma proteobacterium symbiont of Ctena orbiculata]MBT2989339.1 response regulator transcription factor [Candidatus Thiodiazotropha taylori]MBT2996919.1 response regulator transcription factor [Candidatus Thiodiazotropha taylori]MBT3000774.1 response regulator transcription factor [Candidatus Thiodiazotropha taylori]